MAFTKLTINELLQVLNKYNHTELHVHHTWKPTHQSLEENTPEQLQENMRHFHVHTNKWDDIAQHVTLFPDGTFLTGRAFNTQPISIKGYNGSRGKYPFMVEMLGNFDTPNTGVYNDLGYDKLEGKQLESILKLVNYFDKQNKYVRFHRENASKTCPGTSINKEVLMRMAKEIDKSNEAFSDVKGHWAESDIRLLLKEGLMSGRSDKQFHPDEMITRAEVASVVARLLKRK